jgi:hypothetical protein
VVSFNVQNILFALKDMLSIDALSLRVTVQSLILISLDVPLTTLVGTAGKRKQFLTSTQKTAIAKLKQLRSARLIQGEQTITTRHANALNKTNNS